LSELSEEARVPLPIRHIPPCIPTLRSAPPTSSAWIHEVKFDGWRVQLHKHGSSVALYTRNGYDCTCLRCVADDLVHLPGVRSCVIDGELVACDANGAPDFYALHFRRRSHSLCVWAFDLLYVNGRDLRGLPLVAQKRQLEKLVLKAQVDWLQLSEPFDDGVMLLNEADRRGLEGIVSKRADSPYRSGRRPEWIKVKCASWREVNRERWQLFERRR
jgi:bifunctional non-homologous end joining protein LigD